MTRTDRFLIALLVVVAFLAAGAALAQEGAQTPGEALDDAIAVNDAQDAEIAASAARITLGEAKDAAQDSAILGLADRLTAVEELLAGPVPPVDPDPEPEPEPEPGPDPDPVPPAAFAVSLVDLDARTTTAIEGGRVTAAAGRYTIEAAESAQAPVAFLVNGAPCASENFAPFHACGDNNAAPLLIGENRVAITDGAGAAVTVVIVITGVEPDPEPEPEPTPDPEPTEPRETKLQGGPHYSSNVAMEQPFANILRAGQSRWLDGGDSWKEVDPSVLDPETGLPDFLPGGHPLTTDVILTGDHATRLEFDGDWIARADCEGDVEIGVVFAAAEMVTRRGPCDVRWTRDMAGGRTPYHNAISINRLNGTIANLRVCRVEDEARCEAGAILSSRFLAAARRYDVLRLMNWQHATTCLAQSVDDFAGPRANYWSNETPRAADKKPKPFCGMPIKAAFDVAIEADAELWFHAPMTLGAPAAYDSAAIGYDAGQYRAMARENAAAILESPEWDRYADAFVAALIASGYPADRPLYATVANEVWNFAGEYNPTTNYAWGIGEGMQTALGYSDARERHGYGVLISRFKVAIDAALARAGRAQDIVYVIESQAAWDYMTASALNAANRWVAHVGRDWKAERKGFAISVASYWAGDWGAFASPEEWQDRIAADPAGTMDAFERFIMEDPANFGAPWVYAVVDRHIAEAKKWSIPFLGFYEGGSHLERAPYIDAEWWKAFLWGPHGGRINAAVNAELARRIPGVILSDYVLAGPIGAGPWGEGPLGADNAYAKSWAQFMKGGAE